MENTLFVIKRIKLVSLQIRLIRLDRLSIIIVERKGLTPKIDVLDCNIEINFFNQILNSKLLAQSF